MILSLLAGYLLYTLEGLHRVEFIATGSFFASLAFLSEQEILVDASRYFTYAKIALVYGIDHLLTGWGTEFGVWTDMPGVPLLHSIIFTLVGESRIYIQIFNALLFAMSVFLTARIASELSGNGLLAALIFISSPYIYTQIPLFLVDVPTMFFFTATLYLFIKSGNKKYTVISALLLAFSLLCKYSLWIFLMPLPALILVRRAKNKVYAFLLGLLIFILVVYLKYEVFTNQIALLTRYQMAGLKRWGESFTSIFLFQLSFLIIPGCCLAAYRVFKYRDWKTGVLFLFLLPVFILKIERLRYLLPLLPVMAVLASYGLSELRFSKVLAFSSAVFAFLIASLFYLPFVTSVSTYNLKTAGEFLNTLSEEEAGVIPLQGESIINPIVTLPILDIYTTKRLYFIPTEYTHPGEKIKRSSLRFTWEYRLPEFYLERGRDKILVIISQKKGEFPPGVVEMLQNYTKLAAFESSSHRFKFRTYVYVYSRRDAS